MDVLAVIGPHSARSVRRRAEILVQSVSVSVGVLAQALFLL